MKTLKFLIGLISTLFLVSCGNTCVNMLKGKGEGEKAIQEFHTLFNEQKIAEIYDAASADFQKAATKPKLEELLAAVFRKLGKVTGTKNQNWNVKSFNLSTYVVLVQETTFEQGKGVETFTFLVQGGKAVLQGYNINSNDLITK